MPAQPAMYSGGMYIKMQQLSHMKKIACFALVILIVLACRKKDATAVIIQQAPVFAKGADISWVTAMEKAGLQFYNAAGKPTECMALLQSLGMNTIRLRVWVNPAEGWNNAADVLVKALRAKALGMRIMIDFHYSDNWADPGKQTKPAAWQGQDIDGLAASLAAHTSSVLTLLKNNQVSPEWVQVGNETNDGMLWPEGRASASMHNFAQLVNAGYTAVKLVFPDTKVIVHISNGYDNALFRWMFDGLTAQGARFDVIGMSLYPSAANWADYNTKCLANMNDMVTRYGKAVMIVETGMNWDNAVTCKSFLTDLIKNTQSVGGGKGLGVLYWEPEAFNNWQGYPLGAFNNNGQPSIALEAFAGQ